MKHKRNKRKSIPRLINSLSGRLNFVELITRKGYDISIDIEETPNGLKLVYWYEVKGFGGDDVIHSAYIEFKTIRNNVLEVIGKGGSEKITNSLPIFTVGQHVTHPTLLRYFTM